VASDDGLDEMTRSTLHEVAGGEIVVWAEQGGPVMIKLVEPHGDPVELGEGELDELVAILIRLRKETS
jgi:hypothetical protein